MINLRSLLEAPTNNNLQGPNMPKYGFTVLMSFIMCLLYIICYMLPIHKMRFNKAGGGDNKDNALILIILCYSSSQFFVEFA